MNLLHIYNMLNTGEITHQQAAAAFGFSESNLTFRIKRYGMKLPFVLATLDKIKSDQINRIDAAEALGVSTRYVNKLMESWSIVRPIHETMPYLVSRASSQVKWDVRKKYAVDFIAGTISFEMASEAAGCSVRQIRRWVSDLLSKHYGMAYKDLAQVPLQRRARLAQEIRAAENLELAKQQMVDAIADGKMSLKDEAIKRVIAKRSSRKKQQNGTQAE